MEYYSLDKSLPKIHQTEEGNHSLETLLGTHKYEAFILKIQSDLSELSGEDCIPNFREDPSVKRYSPKNNPYTITLQKGRENLDAYDFGIMQSHTYEYPLIDGTRPEFDSLTHDIGARMKHNKDSGRYDILHIDGYYELDTHGGQGYDGNKKRETFKSGNEIPTELSHVFDRSRKELINNIIDRYLAFAI